MFKSVADRVADNVMCQNLILRNKFFLFCSTEHTLWNPIRLETVERWCRAWITGMAAFPNKMVIALGKCPRRL